PTPKIIPMSERKAYQIYAEMRKIDRIKDLFELRRQLAYIQAATTGDKHEWGRILDIEEMIENMDVAVERLKEMEEKPKPEGEGYKSTVE
ncbi:MAG: hypothetical protein ACTSPI_15875, partial [Candidatus Heimdallarchaeaceae archaeon]